MSYQHPKPVMLGLLALVAMSSIGVFRLSVESTTDSILDRTSSPWQFYQKSQRLFGGDEVLAVVIDSPAPFSPSALRLVWKASHGIGAEPGVRRVDSLATVPSVRVLSDGSLSLAPVLTSPSSSVGEREELARVVSKDPIALRNLVSVDGRSFAINVVLEEGSERYYETILAAIDRELRGSRYWVSGVPIFRMEADRRTRGQIVWLVPWSLVAIGSLLFLIFRSWRAVAISLGTSAVGTLLVMGFMGGLGARLTITTIVLPSVLLALSSAYTIHLLTAAIGRDDRADVVGSMERVALPIALSALTTALGFVAVAFVEIEAVRQIGIFGAVGVLILGALALLACPAVVSIWSLKPRPLARLMSAEACGRLIGWIGRRRRWVIAAWLLTVVGCGVGLRYVSVETNVIVWFPVRDEIRVAYEAIRSRLSGISPINVVIEAPDGRRVSEPMVVEALDGLRRHLEGMPEVGRALSISEFLQAIHPGFVGASGGSLPDDEAMIEQYLLLLESKPQTGDFITRDRSAANLVLRVNDNSSASLLRVAREAETWWQASGPQGFRVQSTGIMHEFARAQDAIARGQIDGLIFSVLTVGIVLFLTFRWLPVVVVALIPNVVPIVMMFGVMGLVGFPIDAATVIIGSLALGIAVDDTIHLIECFDKEARNGMDSHAAMTETFIVVLEPVVYTSVVVALGFVVLGVSDFKPVQNLGVITALVMVLCPLADVFLLPALLMSLKRKSF
jgi:hypothetical protein